METAAVLHGQAHMLMLCVCGTLIVLTAQGVPVLRKSGPTPQFPAKPMPYTYVPKRFLRIWAKKQDELMMEGPSGDGPEDAWDSPLLPERTSETHQTSDDYATRSPLPEDILPSQSEPFPSIIDTEIESSEMLREEFISRSSVPFHGPSSLLNTLIFRPSLPDESPSSFIPTPTLSSSTVAQTSPYDLSASWTEIDEAASSFWMSSRRALSYSPSEVFAIITAISATYIYQEDSETLVIDPSNVVSGYPFGSLPSNKTSHPSERLPDLKNTSTFNISVHLQNSDASYFDISSKNPISYEIYHSVSKLQPSFTSNLFPVGVSEALTDGSSDLYSSNKHSISTDERPLTIESSLSHFTNTTDESSALINPFTQWNSYSASITIHTSGLSSEAYYFSNNTLDSSFVQSLLLQESTGVIPMLTPQRTFFLSDVETTVTIIDNKDTPFTYVLPTLTVTGTTISGTYGIFTSYPEDFSFIPSLENEMEVTLFDDFSTFKHLSSSFDTFSTVDYNQGLRSTVSYISMENIVSANSTLFENETDFLQSKSVSRFPKPSSSATAYSYFSTIVPINETGASSVIPFKNHSVSETMYRPELSVLTEAVLNEAVDFREDFKFSKTQIDEGQTIDLISFNETESYQQMSLNISLEYSPSRTLPSKIVTTMLELNEKPSTIDEMFEPLATSFPAEEQMDSSWKSTDVLSNEMTKQDNRSKSEKTATFIQSENLQLPSNTIKDEMSTAFEGNFLDPFTHHITVRSLKDTSNFDILTRVLLDVSTSNGFDERRSASDAMEESRIATANRVSNLHETGITPTLTSMSLQQSKSEAMLPDFVTSHSEHKITAYHSLLSKNLLDDESSVISSKSEVYFLESPFIPSKTLYSEHLFHSQNATYLSDQYFSSYNQGAILPHNQSDFTESYTIVSSNLPITYEESTASETLSGHLKSIRTVTNAYSLDSWLSDDFETTKNINPLILPSEISLEPLEMTTSLLLSTYNQLTSVHLSLISQLDNHLLESSNASSKALDGTLSLINESKSGGIDLKFESEKSNLLISENFQSDLNIFASDYFMTPTLPLSSINLETMSSKAESTFELEEPKRSYFEFHESTRIFDPEIKPLTPRLFSSSDYVRSAVYDSFETSSDILKDFKVSSTLITDFYQSSFQSNLFSSLQPESPFISSPSEKATFSSFPEFGYSGSNGKTLDSAMEISYDKFSPSSEVISFKQIQSIKSPEIEQVSLLSSTVESSFPEMSRLDLNTYLYELSLLSKVSSPVWSADFLSTAFKQPRSMDSFLAKHETQSYFSPHISTGVLTTKESDLSSLIISSIKELESLKSETTREVPSLIATPFLSDSSLLSEAQQAETFNFKYPSSLHSDYHKVQTANFSFLSSEYIYNSLKTFLESVIFSSTDELSSKETYFSSPIPTFILSSMLSSRQPLSLFSSPMHPTNVESYFPKSVLSPAMSSILSSEHYHSTLLKSEKPLSIESYHSQSIVFSSLSTSYLPGYENMISAQISSNVFSSFSIKEPINIESDQPELDLTRTLGTPILPYSNSNYDTPPVYPKDLKNIESLSHQSETYFTGAISQTPVLPHYDTTPVYPKEEPKSIDSVFPQSRNFFTRTVSQTPVLPHSDFKPHYDTKPVYPEEEPKSIDSVFPQSRNFFTRTVSQTPVLPHSDFKPHYDTKPVYPEEEPKSIYSGFPQYRNYFTRTVSQTPVLPHSDFKPHYDTPPVYPKEEPKSIDSVFPQSRNFFTRTVSQTPVLPHSDFKPHYDTKPVYPEEEPKSIYSGFPQSRNYFTRTVSQTPVLPHSDFKPHYDTPPVYPKEEPKSIDSVFPQSRTYFIRTASGILDPSDLAKLLPTPSYTKIKEPKSIESDFLGRKVSSSFRGPLLSHASFWSVKPQFDSISSRTSHRLESSISRIRPTSVVELSPVILRTEVSSTWSSAVPDSTDVILVSVLPVSSFLNVNQTKNGTSDRSHLDESQSADDSEVLPTRNTFLFKDNHYWILTVLEAPAKGQLPENFSHIMENRLANAYSEALRNWPSEKEGKDIVVVKILSVTDDLLLHQLDIVYVVEKGGSLVPSALAAEHLNALRFEQLREFLGHHAIEKARPYRPPGGDVSRPVGSPLPVLAIVGGLLLALLLIFCCICLYCRCCRPKPAPASPGSSASGSLQRSLSKYGQHNRKHLFREMTHQLTAEMAAQIKHGSTAPDAYRPEKSALSGRSLPALPRESDDSEKKADPSMKILKILENKEASSSPMPEKQSRGTNGALQSSDTSSAEKKKPPPKPKKRRKVKESGDQASRNAVPDSVNPSKESKPESPPPTPPPKMDVSIPAAGASPDSGTSSRHSSSQPSSSSEKEAESEGSRTELLPPIQDLIDRSKSESEAAAAEAQMHLSRVRQRISEILDDAFAMAGGKRLYGSLRSKKIEPTAEVLPRFGSFRSQSATGGELAIAKHPGSTSIERRPISEGGQRLLGVLTDEGQLITHPTPKLVWDQEEGYPPQSIERPLGTEMVEARNRNINLFPFQPQRIHQLPALPPSSSLPLLDTLPESRPDVSLTHALREAASELSLPLSARMNPATGNQYDELDVVSALRNGEPVEALIQAIKDELQRFAGSLPGAEESNA